MQASLQSHDGCAVLRVVGDLRLWDHAGVEHEMLKLVPPDKPLPGNRLVLNLTGLTHIDSLGITALVKVVIGCVKREVGIGTILPSGTAGQSIRSTRIFAAWPEFENEDAALRQFAQAAS